ncbi:hypothetical protein DFR58_105128 [Anaerobacterium chartisolvens]|uniref:Aminoacyl-transfer RNA synthetases class-II family profile domain-containing protein n=1 Tax=Anaerobacterium chartisolvens TaxID=1297424 RepID=A0A369BF89_9FIRM|nr:hypothetical protein [Anaerobacterium chartisolvens]RCX18364.1 hypothetical protein DFR58_105128 [Anaerobacterium chartisolvens]
MKTEIIMFRKPIPQIYTEELYRRIYFIASEILDFTLSFKDENIQAIEVKITDDADVERLAQKINLTIEAEITTQKILPPKIVWQSSDKSGFEKDVFDRLVEKGLVFEMGEGQLCFGEPFIRLMDALDDKIKDIAISKMGGYEYRYPTLIPTRALEDCGYFNSFPHMLMMVTRLHSDVETYEAFAREYGNKKGIDSYVLNYCNNTDYCLPPTMCYHTYHHMRNTESNENRVVTSKGKSFRFESKYFRTLERLWDFTIREIVFMGSKDFVLECRQKFMEASFALIESLDLKGHCEVASDPFFCSPDTASKIFNQKMQKLKYELRLNIEEDKTIAAASFNFHDQFFGQRFNIKKSDSNWISTGCVGFGIERLAYVFACKHGLDEDKWVKILDGVKTL